MDLLTKVTIGLGPSIYNADGSTVARSDPSEMDTVRQKFLIGQPGLSESDNRTGGIDAAVEIYGKSERRKFRAGVYYLRVKHFGKAGVYA